MTHYLSHYARFANKKDMDTAARRHGDLHAKRLSRTDRAILEMIRCYSVKFLAAHLKHDTFEKKLSLSNSTVRRSLRKLEHLRIIERIAFVRPVMSGVGANIYVILPADDQSEMTRGETRTQACSDAVCTPIPDTEASSSKAKDLQDLTNTYHSVKGLESKSLFSRMKELLAISGDEQKARSLYGIYRSVSSMLLKYEIHQTNGVLFEQLAAQAVQITVMAQKRKNIRSLPGYFDGVFRKLICQELFQETAEPLAAERY